MENTPVGQQATANQIYQYAANMMVAGKNDEEVRESLVARGLTGQDADTVISTLADQLRSAKRKRAQKDMLFGALWCAGGLGLTMAHIGFIFWGAIIFGAIQFFRGVSNLR